MNFYNLYWEELLWEKLVCLLYDADYALFYRP
jgi:hypothetical protein